jgi:hypothetical protein
MHRFVARNKYLVRSMPRAVSFVDDDVETFPLHVRLIYEADLSWSKDGKCRTSGQGNTPWTILPKETITLGKHIVEGKVLIAMALEVCRGCPVQWDCARHALESAPHDYYIWGTWGAKMEDLRWLKRQADGLGRIEDAHETNEPVQVMIKRERTEQRKRTVA